LTFQIKKPSYATASIVFREADVCRLKGVKRRRGNAEWTWEQSAVDRFRSKKTTGLTVEDLEVVSSLLLSKRIRAVVL